MSPDRALLQEFAIALAKELRDDVARTAQMVALLAAVVEADEREQLLEALCDDE